MCVCVCEKDIFVYVKLQFWHMALKRFTTPFIEYIIYGTFSLNIILKTGNYVISMKKIPTEIGLVNHDLNLTFYLLAKLRSMCFNEILTEKGFLFCYILLKEGCALSTCKQY
jgi:hypothetical protein